MGDEEKQCSRCGELVPASELQVGGYDVWCVKCRGDKWMDRAKTQSILQNDPDRKIERTADDVDF